MLPWKRWSSRATFPVSIQFRNVDSLYYAVYKINIPFADSLHKRWEKLEQTPVYRSFEQFVADTMRSFKPLLKNGIQLPKTSDYRLHTTELAMPSLPAGMYIFLFSSSRSFKSLHGVVSNDFIVASNISAINRTGKNNKLEGYALDRKSGKPLQGVKVMIFEKNFDYRTQILTRKEAASQLTNADGYFSAGLERNRGLYTDFILREDTLPGDLSSLIEFSNSPKLPE
ncbi:MAG: DUF4198 domain-containing protein [Bacteroidales bacterium]|nr:DUF4198 domain-containing protein [Bacteroidales bacterium]